MNIGIIVYSQTGNTLEVAGKLKEKYAAAGHAASLEQVTMEGKAEPGKFQLTTLPDTTPYDTLVFGAPVHAFSLVPVMSEYLKQIPSLAGKKVACFVTKQLPFHWTGGKQAVNKMSKICRELGADVAGTEIVIWSKSGREQSISGSVENLTGLFG